MAPFFNLSVAIGGSATPCCEFKGSFGDIKLQSIEEIWHGQHFRDFRATMLRDEHDDRCCKCYEMEETGGVSLRKIYNEKWLQFDAKRVHDGDRFDDPVEALGQLAASSLSTLPVALDIRFSNLCNFSCRMCFHGASSKWFSDARKMGWTEGPDALITTFTSLEAGMQTLRPLLATVEQIYFAGGEPLLLEQHYAILNELIAQGRTNVALAYNSNMSELRLGRQDVLALWSQFKQVLIEVSVDGAEARGELIREGMVWTDFIANVNAVKQRCPHVRMTFGITVSVFNIWALPDLYRDLMALGVCGEHDFHLHVLQEPEYYSIRILPRRIKRKIMRRLEAYASKAPAGPAGATDGSIQGQFRHIIEHMMAVDRLELIEYFRTITLRLDEIRNKSTAAICPELAPLLRSPFPKLRHHIRIALRNSSARLKIWSARA